jgi:hypothetical protein
VSVASESALAVSFLGEKVRVRVRVRVRGGKVMLYLGKGSF